MLQAHELLLITGERGQTSKALAQMSLIRAVWKPKGLLMPAQNNMPCQAALRLLMYKLAVQ